MVLFCIKKIKRYIIHGKNNFTEVFKNLATYIHLKILLDHQYNYAGNSSVSDAVKRFDILTINLSLLHYTIITTSFM